MGEVYGEGRLLYFTHRRNGGHGGAESYARGSSEMSRGDPVIVEMEIPWERVGGVLGGEPAAPEELDRGEVFFHEYLEEIDNSTWIVTGIEKDYIESELI
ncbi:MAG: hypothetical protein ABEJ36_01910 [Candidatus Nanosalina sp.]